MNERTPVGNFEPRENGLLLPVGYEGAVNPSEAVLNDAMHIGMEQGLGSIKYVSNDAMERSQIDQEKAFADILDPRNVIELKQAIDNNANKRNAEESHLGNTKDGSKQAREATNKADIKASLVEDYLHTGDEEKKREIPELIRKDLDNMLSKSYKELEKRIDAKEKIQLASAAKDGTEASVGAGNADKDASVFGAEVEFSDDPNTRANQILDELAKIDFDGTLTPELKEQAVQKMIEVAKKNRGGDAITPEEEANLRTAVDHMVANKKAELAETARPKKMETVITHDPEEAKEYWRTHLKDSGIALEDYAVSETGWLVEREVKQGPRKKAVTKRPAVDAPKGDDLYEWDDSDKVPTGSAKVLPPRVASPERPVAPRQPERKVRRWAGRTVLAALALLPGGYAIGRAHENYIVKSHDTPTVDQLNKFEDHTRGASKSTQENMVSNYNTTRRFLDPLTGISSETGKANFSLMESQVKEEVAKITKQHGDSLSKRRIQELAEQRVSARLNAMALHNAEKAAAKAKK